MIVVLKVQLEPCISSTPWKINKVCILSLIPELSEMLSRHPVVGLLGPRQVGKTTLALGVNGQTVSRYIELLCDLLLVRRLTPWSSNAGKRMVKSPKVYVRDSGLVHALLGIPNLDDLLAHPVAGMSWEGWVIENLIAAAPAGTEAFCYRTSAGAEIDLVLELRPGNRWAIECKRSLTPTPARGFHEGCKELEPERKLMIYPGAESYPLGQDVECVPLLEAVEKLYAI